MIAEMKRAAVQGYCGVGGRCSVAALFLKAAVLMYFLPLNLQMMRVMSMSISMSMMEPSELALNGSNNASNSGEDVAKLMGGMKDEALVQLARSGDISATEYLIQKYKNFVRVKAKSYFLVGADREDIIQEGMIGLYKSIRDFRADKSNFKAFAELCITRQIITAIKTATRQKHIPLNQYVSLNKPIYDDDSDRTMLDILPITKVSNPEELFISAELSSDLREKIQQNLSELEAKVLKSYLEGMSYQDMAKEHGRHVKSIDNALQRVKRKIEKTLGSQDR